MPLAIFDLDNTLLAGDSDHAWGTFLANQGLTDRNAFIKQNDAFYEDYAKGQLDIHAYQAFVMEPVINLPIEQLMQLQQIFLETEIKPIMLPKAKRLIEQHRQQGDYLLIITATNEWITRPIANLFEVDHLIATQLVVEEGRITNRIHGIPSFRKGKVERLNAWLANTNFNLDNSYFYSDSFNDLPLLEKVTHPVVVDGDEKLLAAARQRGWEIMSLR